MASNFARALRSNPTDAERKLWVAIRFKQLGGARFRRQQPIGRYIIDFFCPDAKLVIELDGDQHGTDEMVKRDTARTSWLESQGYTVLRFANWEVLKERRRVLEVIVHALESSPHPSRAAHAPTSPSRGEVQR
jgi:very-short-patch-repair endonuclease